MGEINARKIFAYARQADLAADYFAKKMGFTIGQAQLKRKIEAQDKDFQVMDTREQSAWREAHIPGALWVNAANIEEDFSKFDKAKVNIVHGYGSICLRGSWICLQAAKAGYPVMELLGNYDGWTKGYGFPTEGGN